MLSFHWFNRWGRWRAWPWTVQRHQRCVAV